MRSDTSRSEHRVALLGYGLAGAFFHAPLIAVTPGLRLAVVVTRDPDRRARAEREHPGVRVVASADEVWAMARELDLAVIATPNRTHVPLALEALQAGLHVVVDKPLARTADEGRRVVAEAQRRGRMLTVFQNRRWDGDFLTVRRILESGDLGDVHRFESRFERWRPVPKPGWRELGDLEEAGGILYDLGSHLVDQALVLFGPARHVVAEVDRRRAGVQVDDDVFVAIDHASGVRSHLHMSAVAAQPGPRFRVSGNRAAYVKHGLDVQEEMLRAGRRPGPGWGEEPSERWGTLGTTESAAVIRTERGDYPAFYARVAEAMRDGAGPPVDAADAIAALQILEAARASAQEQRVIGLRRH